MKNKEFHGMTKVPEYSVWNDMRKRCNNPKSTPYPWYGGLGIKVCEEWERSFRAFYEYMGPRPEGHEIDREDVNGNYEPGNCRWVDAKTQARNKKASIYFIVDGKRSHLKELAEQYGIAYKILWQRMSRNNMSIEQALARGKGKIGRQARRAVPA